MTDDKSGKASAGLKCVVCGKELTGKQAVACSQKCWESEIGRRRRESGYYRRAMQKRRDAGLCQDACSRCGGLKQKKASYCVTCYWGMRRLVGPAKRVHRARRVITQCHYCDGEFRTFEWHNRTIYKCSGCGLETTRIELTRIRFEELAA